MKQNLKNTKSLQLSLKLEEFFTEQLWQHVVVLSAIAFCAYITNKWIESAMFFIAHWAIRAAFDKQLHFNCTATCLSVTVFIFWLGIVNTLPISISLLSSIPVAFAVSYVGFIIQDRLDLYIKIRAYETVTIWHMSEEQLRAYCKLKGITRERIDFVVYVVIHQYRFAEIADRLGYSLDTIKDWSELCKKKLNIKSWVSNK